MTKTIKVVLASQILFLIVCNISFVKYSNAMHEIQHKKPKLDIVQTPLNNNNDPNKPSYNVKKSTHPQIWKLKEAEEQRKKDIEIKYPNPIVRANRFEKTDSFLKRTSGHPQQTIQV
uniref:Uncharacterized protein n=1 Tax=Meloidogyne enterolobii TaxID=390850 RepID=A0A6V7VHM4_MELEN|nr:unnamed protein product [Meloidogyne enterolobii]